MVIISQVAQGLQSLSLIYMIVHLIVTKKRSECSSAVNARSNLSIDDLRPTITVFDGGRAGGSAASSASPTLNRPRSYKNDHLF